MQTNQIIWHNGEIKQWQDFAADSWDCLSFAESCVKETIPGRVGKDDVLLLFRAQDHAKRLIRSAKTCFINVPLSPKELTDAAKKLLEKALENKKNATECRIDMRAFNSGPHAHVLMQCWLMAPPPDSLEELEEEGIDVAGALKELEALGITLEDEELDEEDDFEDDEDEYDDEDPEVFSVSAAISSWRRFPETALMHQAFAAPSVMEDKLMRREALASGCDEAIILNAEGHVADATGYAAVFAVRDGALSTPPLADGPIESIARDSVLHLALDLEIPVIEESLTRTDLRMADELFLCSDEADIQPVHAVDGCTVGAVNEYGPIAKLIAERLESAQRGEHPNYAAWIS